MNWFQLHAHALCLIVAAVPNAVVLAHGLYSRYKFRRDFKRMVELVRIESILGGVVEIRRCQECGHYAKEHLDGHGSCFGDGPEDRANGGNFPCLCEEFC